MLGRYAVNRINGLFTEIRQQGRGIMEQVARTPKQLGNLLREFRPVPPPPIMMDYP
jgi:hypothetical protein